MTIKTRLNRLSVIAGLIRDRDLARLRQAAAAREETRALIAGLDAASATDLDLVTGALVEQSYHLWAERRRAELNLCLARQTADWLQCQQKAAQGFGKAEILSRLMRRY